MAELRVFRTLVTLGVLLFTTQIHSQKILSNRKKCGDPQCESLMMRVSAKRDYSGPDCRFLTFKTGDEINVYYKLTGRREDLWQGSKEKAYGFFPKDTVTIEEVYLSEEIEIPAQEIDFVCLDGGEYFFENEDSVLHKSNEDPMDHPLQEGGLSTEDIIAQETPEPEAPEKESWAPSGIARWFGMGKNNEKKDTETDAKNIKMETINEEAEPQKQPEEPPAENSGWLGGRIKKFLPFGEQRDEPETKDMEAYEEKVSTVTQQTDQEQRSINKDGEDSKSKWFNFGIRNVLGFGAKNEKKEEMNPNVEGTDNEKTPEIQERQDKAIDRNLVTGQSDISRTDQVDKTKDVELNSDIQVENTTITNGPEKGGSDDSATQSIDVRLSRTDQETIGRISDKESTKSSEKQNPSPSQGTTQWFKSIVSNALNIGKGHSKEKKEIQFEGVKHSLQMSQSDEVDGSRQHVASNDFNKYLDTLSQGSELNGLGSVVDGHAKDEFNNLNEINRSKVRLENTVKEMDEGGEEKQRLEEAEHSTQTLESTQTDDSRERVAKSIDVNEYSDTLSQEIDVNGLIHEVSSVVDEHAKDDVHNLKEVHQPKVHLEDALTEKDNTFQDEGGEYDEKPRFEEAEYSTRTSESSQADNSREHIVMINEYADTLSQEIVDGLKHGAGSVITDDHDKAEVINHEEVDQSTNSCVDKWTMKGESKYEETFKRLEESFNPVKTQERDEDQNLDVQIYLTSRHYVDESDSTNVGNVSPNPKTVEDTIEETSEELKIETKGSIERKDKPVFTTSLGHDCMRGLTADAESSQDGGHGLTTRSIYTAEDKTTMAGVEIVGPDTKVETDSQRDTLGSAEKGNEPASLQLESHEDREDMKSGADTPKSSQGDNDDRESYRNITRGKIIYCS